MMTAYQNLISPRSRAPIVFSDEDEEGEEDSSRAQQHLKQQQQTYFLATDCGSGAGTGSSVSVSSSSYICRIGFPISSPGVPVISAVNGGGSGGVTNSNPPGTTNGHHHSYYQHHQQQNPSEETNNNSNDNVSARAIRERQRHRSLTQPATECSQNTIRSSQEANTNGTISSQDNKLLLKSQTTHKSLALPASTPTTYPLSSILRGGTMSIADTAAGDLMARTTAVQNRLEEEASAYKRRLESYRQAQHQQALLVARLQSKLLQYKQRCTDLEVKLGQSPVNDLHYYQFGSPVRDTAPEYSSSSGRPTAVSFAAGGGTGATGGGGGGAGGGTGGGFGVPADLDDALWKLEQERIRNENLIHLNRDLRSELDETRKINNALSSDLQKLSDDWDKLTKQMVERENLWKAEEQAYSDYYASEHSKLLALWKKVAATKRDFAEMKSATGRDMAQLKNNISRISNQISSGVITASVSSPTPQQEAEQSAFIAQLTHELNIAQTTHENLRRQLKDRDDKITALENNIADLDGKTQTLEQELNRISNQELGLLQNSLREIGKLLLNDFDQHGLEDGHDLHLTSTPAIFIYDESGENPTVFAESIVSAVQASLNKRQLQIHSLQVSLNSAKEQGLLARGHVESLEQEMSKAEEKITQLTDCSEKLKDALENVRMERDTAQRALDNLRNEKNILEQQRKALASELESTVKIKNNMSTNLSKVEKALETCRDEIDSLTMEIDKTRDELNSKTSQLKLEQDLNLKLRDQLGSVGEDKERNISENKALKTQLNELTTRYEDVSFQFERSEDSLKKWKMDAEILSEKLRLSTERTEATEKEKKKWAEKARNVEEIKLQLESELQDARNDLTSLRREMLESERVRTDLEAKVEKEIARADGAENRRQILESQIDSQRDEFLREINITTEKAEIINEELNNIRRELEDTYQALERTKADLSNSEKLHMEAVHLIEQKESILKNLTNTFEKTRDEKMSLEELEETLKTALIEKDKKIESLDRQMADLKSKMNAELDSTKDKLKRTEKEMKNQMEKADQEKSQMEQKYTKELVSVKSNSGSNEEKMRSEYEDKLKTLRVDLEGDKKNECNKLNSEIASLRSQIDSLRVQYEEALLRAENDKQQGLLLAQQDQQGLSDKIRLLERELEDLKNEKDRMKRDCEAKCNHEKNTAASLRSELIKLRNELETTKQDGLDSLKIIEGRLTDIDREREVALLHVEELRNKLRTTEEREAELKKELGDVNRKLKDSESSGDFSKKEIAELRRTLSEMAMEKEKTNNSMELLKEDVNRRENELMIMKKELNKIQGFVKLLEKTKAELEAEVGTLSVKLDAAARERSEGSRYIDEVSEQLTQARNYAAKLESETTELKVKFEAETERRDEAEAQWRNCKKMLDETEGQLNLTKGEEERLALKLAEAEERYGVREGQLMAMADDNKVREKKLMEEKHNLNIALNSVHNSMEQLTGKLSSAEHRLKTLTDEKSDLEQKRKESEAKLNQIQSGFKRLGISAAAMDNPDAARRVMATLQTQMAALQQDRDTLATQLRSTKDALTTCEMTKSNVEDQLALLSRNLQISRADCKTKEQVVFNLEKEVALKNGELTRLADKVREGEDSVKSKEDAIRGLKSEKDTQKEELEKTRQKWEETRAQSESKWAKAEVNMRALEGDLNRMALVLQQKDSHIQAMEEKCSSTHRNNTELEERCASLTMTVEQLNISLEKLAQGEQDWKDKHNSVSRNASENSAQVAQLNEKLRVVLRDKTMVEQEKNNLNEKWEGASAALQDFKRQVQVLAEKNQKLRLQTEEMTRNAIDKQLKQAFAESGSGKEDMRQILSEKLEMQRRLDSLLDKIRDLERENRELERVKDSVSMKGSSGRSSGIPSMRDNAVTVLEEENSELRRKINKMEAEIRDLERRHTKHIGEVTTQVKQERDFELERARAAKLQAERLLEARETNYRQQIARLEQQTAHLKEQLGEEIRRRQSFLSRSFRTGQEIRSLRQALGDSLRNVSMDPNTGTMETETRRLDTTLDLHKSASQSSLMSPQMRDPSPYKSSTPIPKM